MTSYNGPTEHDSLTFDGHHCFPEVQFLELLRVGVVVVVVESVEDVLEFERGSRTFLDSGAGDGSACHLERQVGSDLV